MQPAVVTSSTQERALDATVALVARWGVAKTTLGDVAREAGTSRATLYRAFPGGKDELFDRLARREIGRFLAVVADACDAAADLPSALADALHAAAVHLRDHVAIGFVLAHEPEVAVPVLGFGAMDELLCVVRRATATHLVRFLPERPEDAGWAAEWCARLFLSHLVNPTPEWDLTDAAVCARLVDRYLAPAFAPSTSPTR